MGILINLGQHPNVASSVIIYQGTLLLGAAAFQYAVQGALQFDYVLFLGLVILLASVTGDFAIVKLVKMTNRQSLIIFAVAIILTIATAMTLTFQIIRFKNYKIDAWAFAPYCT